MNTLLIIGCGSIGRRHAKVFRTNTNVYAVDINPEG